MLAARNADKLNDVAILLDDLGLKTLVTRCDVTDPETVRADGEYGTPNPASLKRNPRLERKYRSL